MTDTNAKRCVGLTIITRSALVPVSYATRKPSCPNGFRYKYYAFNRYTSVGCVCNEDQRPFEKIFYNSRQPDSRMMMRLVASVCVCLSVCPVRALTFECLDLQTSFLVGGTSSMKVGYQGHRVKVKVIRA